MKLVSVFLALCLVSIARAEWTATPSFDPTPSASNLLNPNNVYYGSNFHQSDNGSSPPFSARMLLMYIDCILGDTNARSSGRTSEWYAKRFAEAAIDRTPRAEQFYLVKKWGVYNKVAKALGDRKAEILWIKVMEGVPLSRILDEFTPGDASLRELSRNQETQIAAVGAALAPRARLALSAARTEIFLERLDGGTTRAAKRSQNVLDGLTERLKAKAAYPPHQGDAGTH